MKLQAAPNPALRMTSNSIILRGEHTQSVLLHTHSLTRSNALPESQAGSRLFFSKSYLPPRHHVDENRKTPPSRWRSVCDRKPLLRPWVDPLPLLKTRRNRSGTALPAPWSHQGLKYMVDLLKIFDLSRRSEEAAKAKGDTLTVVGGQNDATQRRSKWCYPLCLAMWSPKDGGPWNQSWDGTHECADPWGWNMSSGYKDQ